MKSFTIISLIFLVELTSFAQNYKNTNELNRKEARNELLNCLKSTDSLKTELNNSQLRFNFLVNELESQKQKFDSLLFHHNKLLTEKSSLIEENKLLNTFLKIDTISDINYLLSIKHILLNLDIDLKLNYYEQLRKLLIIEEIKINFLEYNEVKLLKIINDFISEIMSNELLASYLTMEEFDLEVIQKCDSIILNNQSLTFNSFELDFNSQNILESVTPPYTFNLQDYKDFVAISFMPGHYPFFFYYSKNINTFIGGKPTNYYPSLIEKITEDGYIPFEHQAYNIEKCDCEFLKKGEFYYFEYPLFEDGNAKCCPKYGIKFLLQLKNEGFYIEKVESVSINFNQE